MSNSSSQKSSLAAPSPISNLRSLPSGSIGGAGWTVTSPGQGKSVGASPTTTVKVSSPTITPSRTVTISQGGQVISTGTSRGPTRRSSVSSRVETPVKPQVFESDLLQQSFTTAQARDKAERVALLDLAKERLASVGRVSSPVAKEITRSLRSATIQPKTHFTPPQRVLTRSDFERFMVAGQQQRILRAETIARESFLKAEKEIDAFNKQFGGRELTESEFAKAQQEEARIQKLIEKAEIKSSEAQQQFDKAQGIVSGLQTSRTRSQDLRNIIDPQPTRIPSEAKPRVKIDSRAPTGEIRLSDIGRVTTAGLNPYADLLSPDIGKKVRGVVKSPFFVGAGFATGLLEIGETTAGELLPRITPDFQFRLGKSIEDPSRLSGFASGITTGLVNLPRTLPQAFQKDPLTVGTSLALVGYSAVSLGRGAILSRSQIVPITRAKTGVKLMAKGRAEFVSTQRVRLGPRIIGKEFDVITKGTAKPIKPLTTSQIRTEIQKITGPTTGTELTRIERGFVDDFIGGGKQTIKKQIKPRFTEFGGETVATQRTVLSRLGFKPKVTREPFIGIQQELRIPKLPKDFALPRRAGEQLRIPEFTGVGKPRTFDTLTKSIVKQGETITRSPVFISRAEVFPIKGATLTRVTQQAIGFKPMPSELVLTFRPKKISPAKGFDVAGFGRTPRASVKVSAQQLRAAKQFTMLSTKKQLLLPEFAGTGFVKPPVSDLAIQNILRRGSFSPGALPKGFSTGAGIGTMTMTMPKTKTEPRTKSFVQTRTRGGLIQLQEVKLKSITREQAKQRTRTEQQFKQFQKTFVATKPTISFKPQTKTAFGFAPSQRIAQKQLERVLSKQATGFAVQQKQFQFQKQGFSQLQSQFQLQGQAFTQLQSQLKQATLTKTVTRTPTTFGKAMPKIKVIPKTIKFDELSTMRDAKPMGTYHAFVRKGTGMGKGWVKVTRKPKPYNMAFNKGLLVADKTTAVTVKVRRVGKKDLGYDDPFIMSEKFQRRARRSNIPGQETIFVEKNRFRIDTLGEKKGLSAAKWKKQRQQQGGFGWAL